ncbi:MAG: ATP-binding cassette domain-containing protein [Bacteroidetes bacterium]|nr:ATP-binding cassette domain-containing protein [Bacteroidota bacterium]
MEERKYNIRILSENRELVAIDEFRVVKSAINVLLGESGIGKSLISLAIAGLIDPDELDVHIDGRPYRSYLNSKEAIEIRRNGFFVFQEPSSHLNPLKTLRMQLREGSLEEAPGEESILRKLWQNPKLAEYENILDVYPKPYRPSGGEKQRILAAMAFKKMASTAGSSKGSVYFFDEPTGNLDNKLRNEFLDLLVENFGESRPTILLITHDYSMISRFIGKYPAIGKNIYYRELMLEHGRLRLRDFQPREYLLWLEKRVAAKPPAEKKEMILRLQPEIKVFGRTLHISRDPAGNTPAPLVIRKGTVTYLKAPSGTGKTTIVKIMMGLIKSEKMSMELGDTVYSEETSRNAWAGRVWGKQMTMVFQHADESLNLNSKVKDVFSGLPVVGSMSKEEIADAISELFEEAPTREFLNKKVRFLSGGQKQRLNLLRSLILHTDIIILDEPLNGLDFLSVAKVITMIETKLQSGIGIMVISHNEEVFDTMVGPENIYYLNSSSLD